MEDVISQGAWSTCIRRVALNQTVNTPLYGYTYEYQLPTDPSIVKLLNVQDEHVNDIDYRVEDDKLLANESAVNVKYVGLITDPGSYGPYLSNVVARRIAAEIAYKLTGSVSMQNAAYGRYQSELKKALAKDGEQGSAQYLHNDTLTRIR